MCTCLFIKSRKSYFGRNMDIHYFFNEKVIFVPRKYPITYKKIKTNDNHYSIIGIGTNIKGYPFFADAINEKGLSIAGLNFLNNAKYFSFQEEKINITPYELPLFLLSACKNIKEVKELLYNINLLNNNFSKDIPLAELHFMVSDKNESIVIESTVDGLKIFDNKYGVLTNNPEFTYHINNLQNYLNLTIKDPISKDINPISYGQGLIGLPGDYSSMSRFIKIYFLQKNIYLSKENQNINQFFYCLDSVLMPKGLVKVGRDYEYTRYSVCYDLIDKILHIKTYENRCIRKYEIKHFNENLNKLTSINFY